MSRECGGCDPLCEWQKAIKELNGKRELAIANLPITQGPDGALARTEDGLQRLQDIRTQFTGLNDLLGVTCEQPCAIRDFVDQAPEMGSTVTEQTSNL